jgi:hypothetical protein
METLEWPGVTGAVFAGTLRPVEIQRAKVVETTRFQKMKFYENIP